MDAASFARLLLLAAIWGAAFLFMRIGAPVFGPALLIELRVAVAALFLLAVARWLKRPLRLGEHWRYYLVIGLFNSALPFLLFAYAAQSLSASLMAILNCTAPISGAVLGRIVLKTPLTRSMGLGLAVSLGGVLVLVGEKLASPGGALLWPLLAGLAAPVSYSVASVYAKGSAVRLDALSMAHGSMWAASVLVLPFLVTMPGQIEAGLPVWGAALALGVLCTGVAYQLYFRLVEDVGALHALSVTFLIPVFGVLWGALFLGEPVGWSLLAGGALVLLGSALTHDMLKPGGRRPEA